MAIDADPSTGGVDSAAGRSVGLDFDVSTNITRADVPYAGYQMRIEYDPGVLQFLPVGPNKIVYTGLGGMTLDVEAVDTGGVISGGSVRSGTTAALGQANLVHFRCIAEGVSQLHLIRPGEAPAFSTTHDPSGAAIGTDLADASISCLLILDSDGDGCLDSRELTLGFSPVAWYDVYDVPVPARPDASPSGSRNQLVDVGDVLAVLFYAFADEGGPANANGVAYDSLKDGDWNGDTVVDESDRVGLRYDRSPGLEPNPPWDAGPPNGVVDIGDVLAALKQAFVVDCSGPP
jgi:hypothetical protein